MTPEREVRFAAPTWLRDVGFTSWLLVGFVLIVLGVIWLLDITSTIVMPLIVASVVGAVAGPLVGWLAQHRIPRTFGAILVLLAIVLAGIGVFLLVVGGISSNSGEISAKLNSALAKIQGSLHDLGIDKTDITKDAQEGTSGAKTTLLHGVSDGIAGLTSIVFFLGLAALSTLFVLKDGPVMHRFIDRHLGVPEPIAHVVTTNVARSLRSYFLGVTIIAAFNAVVIGAVALIVGVPLAGTIAITTFIGAYVPFVGAWVSGAFAVLIALGTEGETAAIIMAVTALLANGALQQMIQPFVMGATLALNPLVVLVVTIGGGALFGMVGLTLAAPLTSAAVHISNELRGRERQSAEGPVTATPAPSG